MHGDDPRGQGHRRLQGQLTGAEIGERRRAIEHDAGAQPVHVRGGNGQHGGRVGQRAMREVQVQQPEEAFDLLLGERMAALVGAGEMAEQVELGDLRGIRQACMPLAQFGGIKAQAVHAGIQLQPDIQRARQLTAQQSLGLRRALQHQVEAELSGDGIFAGLEAALQQQDARLVVHGTHFRSLLQAGHRETVGDIAQRRHHLAHAMPVGIGLDHRERLAARRAALGNAVVVDDGGEVDDGSKRTHGRGPERKTGAHLNPWAPVFIDLRQTIVAVSAGGQESRRAATIYSSSNW